MARGVSGAPRRIRISVTDLRGRRPWPLDDRGWVSISEAQEYALCKNTNVHSLWLSCSLAIPVMCVWIQYESDERHLVLNAPSFKHIAKDVVLESHVM